MSDCFPNSVVLCELRALCAEKAALPDRDTQESDQALRMDGAKSRSRLARWGIGLDLIFNTEVTELTENHRATLLFILNDKSHLQRPTPDSAQPP